MLLHHYYTTSTTATTSPVTTTATTSTFTTAASATMSAHITKTSTHNTGLWEGQGTCQSEYQPRMLAVPAIYTNNSWVCVYNSH